MNQYTSNHVKMLNLTPPPWFREGRAVREDSILEQCTDAGAASHITVNAIFLSPISRVTGSG